MTNLHNQHHKLHNTLLNDQNVEPTNNHDSEVKALLDCFSVQLLW